MRHFTQGSRNYSALVETTGFTGEEIAQAYVKLADAINNPASKYDALAELKAYRERFFAQPGIRRWELSQTAI